MTEDDELVVWRYLMWPDDVENSVTTLCFSYMGSLPLLPCDDIEMQELHITARSNKHKKQRPFAEGEHVAGYLSVDDEEQGPYFSTMISINALRKLDNFEVERVYSYPNAKIHKSNDSKSLLSIC